LILIIVDMSEKSNQIRNPLLVTKRKVFSPFPGTRCSPLVDVLQV